MKNDDRKYFAITHKNGDFGDNHAANLEWIKAPIPVSEGNCYEYGMRSKNEIQKYEREALEKAWFDRTRVDNDPEIEEVREENVGRILATYADIPEGGYNNWESGYWNGILSALRWVLGEERDFLDT